MQFLRSSIVAAAMALSAAAIAQPMTSSFVYQGEIRESGAPSTGPVDLRFRLYDASTGGSQVGSMLQALGTTLTSGRFSASLDFGSVFSGQNRWLEIDIRPAGVGAYTTLGTRQLLSAAPVASYALSIPAQYNTFNANGGNAIFSSGNVGIGISTPAAGLHVTKVQGGMSFDASEKLFVNDTQDFVGVNRSTRATSAEVFGLQNNATQTGFVGMYITSTSATGLPFYGYRTAAASGWTVMDNAGTWRVNMGGVDRLALSSAGNLGLGSGAAISAPAYPLHILSTAQTVGEFDSSNTGGTWLSLNNTASGRTWNIVSSGSGNGEGPGKFFFRDASINAVRMTIDTAGNVGVGTTSPGVKLDVAGTVRATGGVVYPDGSTQFRATDTSPIVTSGLPQGSTFTVTIGGTAATLSAPYKIGNHLNLDNFGYNYQGLKTDGAIKVRRVRTSDQTWLGWVKNPQSKALVMQLSVPGGATVTWAGNLWTTGLKIFQDGGVLYEEMTLGIASTQQLTRTVNGAPAVSVPTGELSGISLLVNGSPIQNVSFIGEVFSGFTVDLVSGGAAGYLAGPQVTVRCNPFSTSLLYPRFITADLTAQPTTIVAGGAVLGNSIYCFISSYTLKLADDGLPIEEMTVAVNPN